MPACLSSINLGGVADRQGLVEIDLYQSVMLKNCQFRRLYKSMGCGKR